MQQRKKLLFIYPQFYPVSGGGTTHGYFLAKELDKLGYVIFVTREQHDGFTTNIFERLNCWKILKALLNIDIFYVRVSPLGKSNLIIPFLRLLGRKVIAEFNAPATEGVNPDQRITLWLREALYRACLRFAIQTVCVSKEVEDYCTSSLRLQKTTVINNGGALANSKGSTSPDLSLFFSKFKHRALWATNNYPWQDKTSIEKLIQGTPDVGFIIATNRSFGFVEQDNLLELISPPREKVDECLLACQVGLALYKPAGVFYNSPLKMYEYLANGMLVITNVSNTEIANLAPDIVITQDILATKKKLKATRKTPKNKARLWGDVALDLHRLIERLT